MKNIFTFFLAILCFGLCISCVQQNRFPTREEALAINRNYINSFNVDLSKSTFSDKSVDVSFKPIVGNYMYKSFDLTIKNKTNKDIKLIWDETFFIENGSTNGKFMFAGVRYVNRDDSKTPDIILANSTFTKEVYPNAKVLQNVIGGGWGHAKIEDGEYGAYVTLQIGNQKKNIKVFVTLSR